MQLAVNKYYNLIWPIGIFSFLLGIYSYTLAPTISWWDCAEFITASWCWGTPHPPGNPLYITLGRIFSMWFKSPEMIARSVNFISALSTAGAAVFIYLSLNSWIKPSDFKQKLSLSLAVIAGFITFSIWDSAVEAEIYGLVSLIISLQIWAVIKILKSNYRYLFFLFYLTGLSVAVHPLPLLTFIPVTAVMIIHFIFHPSRFHLSKYLNVILLIVLLTGLGLSAVFIMYFRAQHAPPLNESAIASLNDLQQVLTRQQYQNHSPFTRQTSVLTGYSYWMGLFWQMASYFNYWSWQHLPMIRTGTGGTLGQLVTAVLSLGLVLMSVYSIWRYRKFKPKTTLLLVVLILLTFSLLLVWIMNLKFCPSDSNPHHLPQEPRSRDYFFAFSYGLLTILALISVVKSNKLLLQIIPGILILILLYNGLTGHPNRQHNYAASSFASNCLNTTRGKSILFVHGDNDTFPLWFTQIVQKTDTSTVIINTSLLNASWYVHQIGEKVPFTLSKVYKDIYLDQWNPEICDYEFYCREHLTTVITESGRKIFPGEIIEKCIILEAMDINYSLNDIMLNDRQFANLITSGTSSCNIYTTQIISYLKPCLVEQGILYQLHQGSRESNDLFDRYIWWGIIRDDNLNEDGEIVNYSNLEINPSLSRDIDSRSMNIFYIRNLESLTSNYPQYFKLLELLKSVMF